MAAGKSTLARELADRENAILFVQDDLLEALFPGEITDIPGFLKMLFAIEERAHATRLRPIGEGYLGRARFSRQYHDTACVVSRADRACEC